MAVPWLSRLPGEQAVFQRVLVLQGLPRMPPRCLSQPSAGEGWAELSSRTYPGKVCRVELEGSSQLRSLINHALISLLKSMQIQPGTALTPIRFNLQCFPDLIHLLWLSGYTLSHTHSRWIISMYKDLSSYLYLFRKVGLSFRAVEKNLVSIINTRNDQVYHFKN